MKHSEFRIGLTFQRGTGRETEVWRCTEVGTNVITAERTDHLDGVHVFNEDEMADCSPTKWQLPPGCRDVTASRIGSMIGILGPVSMTTVSKPDPMNQPAPKPTDSSLMSVPEKPIETDEEMLESILKAHPGLTRKEALEHLRVYGWGLDLDEESE